MPLWNTRPPIMKPKQTSPNFIRWKTARPHFVGHERWLLAALAPLALCGALASVFSSGQWFSALLLRSEISGPGGVQHSFATDGTGLVHCEPAALHNYALHRHICIGEPWLTSHDPQTAMEPRKASNLKVVRLPNNPIIRPEMLPPGDRGNINGPSLIRVPDWVSNPLGRYYLYFAHHSGGYIRLAVADKLEGPWKIHPPGVLRLHEAPGCKGHIASPDVIVVPQLKQIRMYFHCPAQAGKRQMTFVATSSDGLNFKASDKPLCPFYFRAFFYDGRWYGMSKGGLLWRSKDGLGDFEEGINPMPDAAGRDKPTYNKPGVRHVALHRTGDTLWVYYSSIGDAPERILRCPIQLKGDWKTWRAGPAEEVLRPEFDYEGADLPIRRSAAGAAHGREHALRDPAIFEDDGRTYLLYSVAGESGIAIAELREEK